MQCNVYENEKLQGMLFINIGRTNLFFKCPLVVICWKVRRHISTPTKFEQV